MKSSTLKRRSKERMSPAERAAAARWHGIVLADGVCAVCEAFPPTVDTSQLQDLQDIKAHHVIAKSRLKQEGLHDHLWDERNGLAVCEYHHARHHQFVQRIPRSILRRETIRFAREHAQLYRLDMEYPA